MGVKYFKKQKGRTAGSHPYTAENMKQAGWCHSNNIFIAVTPKLDGATDDWKVEIRMNGRTHLDPKTYSGYDAQTKMYEYYKYYYDKNIQKSK